MDAMFTQLPQHIQVPPFMSFIQSARQAHAPFMLLPPPLFLHRAAAAGKKGKKADLGKA